MNVKRSRLVQVMVVAVVMLGLLVAAWPGVAQGERPPLRPEMKRFLEERTRQPDPPMLRHLDSLASDFPHNVSSLPHNTAFLESSKPLDDWASNSAYAFADYSAGNSEIYTSPSYAGPLYRITYNPAYDSMPKLNRGSTRIVFISNRDGNNEVYIMNADGSGQVRLTWTAANEYLPSWSPDGLKIAFYSYRDGNAEIYSMNPDGTNQTRLTTIPAWDGHPSWSPNSAQLVFASDRTGTQELWIMNSDGSNPHLLTPHIGFAAYPDWSPDGNRIAFSADVNADTWLNVAVINTDGTEVRHLRAATPNPNVDYIAPAWSPNGYALAIGVVTWIFYQGEYYWTQAEITNWEVDGLRAQPVACNIDSWGDHTCWFPDWETTSVPPSSQINALPIWLNTQSFTVQWFGTDPDSDLKSYDIQYREGESGAWTDWLIQTAQTSAVFTGQYGHTYYFRSRARDYANNLEAYPSSADAMTTIYQHAVNGQMLDTREQPVAVVNVQANPAALNTGVSRHDGAYDLYFTAGGVYNLTTARSNFGQLPPLLNVSVPTSNSLPTLYLPPLDNLLSDGHFENGTLSAWNASGDLTPTIASAAHTGNYAALLGGSVPTDTLTTGPWHSTIEQAVNVSPTIVSGTLSLLYRVESAEPLSDTLTAYIVGASNMLTLTLPMTATEWTHAWFDLSAWNDLTATVKIDFTVADTDRVAEVKLDEITWGSAITGSHTAFLPLVRR